MEVDKIAELQEDLHENIKRLDENDKTNERFIAESNKAIFEKLDTLDESLHKNGAAFLKRLDALECQDHARFESLIHTVGKYEGLFKAVLALEKEVSELKEKLQQNITGWEQADNAKKMIGWKLTDQNKVDPKAQRGYTGW